tara:strand:- start:262 stop:624 length:363 start_codon:yes stop_codon:yes gene_type:complete
MGTSVNVTRDDKESVVILFDSFYSNEVKVSAAEYDIVLSYFKSVFVDGNLAEDFTTVFFTIKIGYGKTTDELLDIFKGQDGIQVNSTMAYYLNGLRSKTTLIGVNVVRQASQIVSRNIII